MTSSSTEFDQSTDNFNQAKVIILGAGRPYKGATPSALARTSGNRRTLDWTLDSFERVVESEVHFIGGYGLEDIVREYPDLYISVNPHWASHGSLGSLMAAPLTPGQTTYVCYSDVLISHQAVRALRDAPGDVVILADCDWRDRYQARSEADLLASEKVRIQNGQVQSLGANIPIDDAHAEYVGLLKLSATAVNHLIEMRTERQSALAPHGIPRLIEELKSVGQTVVVVEITGGWAELNAPQDLARFMLGTKADTLDRLRPLVRKSSIGDQISFTVGDWHDNQSDLISKVTNKFGKALLVVRSSSLNEDSWARSNAGTYASILNVPGSNPKLFQKAVQEVISSYKDDNVSHQILVQEMLSDMSMQGVVLTRTLSHGAPYYTLNYDDSGSNPESVTSGSGHNLKTVIVAREHHALITNSEPTLAKVLDAVIELETCVGYDALDVEFAVSANGSVHVLQLRPIAVERTGPSVDDKAIDAALQMARQTFDQKQHTLPFVLGKRTFFGIMPDWNPAEIIGPRPRRLALSLYQYLVTDDIWATQRAEHGYRDVRPHPLVVVFAGHPFIDVRACFNSFLPASVPDHIAARLVDYYLDILESQPHLHDKVEFDVAFTCLGFDFHERSKRLVENGFSIEDVEVLRKGLTDVTNRALLNCQEQLNRISLLEQRFECINKANVDPLSRAVNLLEDCRRYGTLPFAHLARAAFIATTLLRSLESAGVTSQHQTESFLNSLDTVAGQFERDGTKVANGELSWDEFKRRYGHLRPGTYEITSPSYSNEPERYLKPMVRAPSRGKTNSISNSDYWDPRVRSDIQGILTSSGLDWSVANLEKFLRQAIEGREYAKFAFSRNLSFALDELAKYGSQFDLSPNHVSHIAVQDLISLHTNPPAGHIGSWLRRRVEEGEQSHLLAQTVELPPLLIHKNDISAFKRHQSQPNFVTSLTVVANAISLSTTDNRHADLEGTIVLIPQADPGYDWLFGHSISGLITMYGGANSHMTIRAAEFGLPAAIGVGESLYNQLIDAEVIELDCSSQWIRAVR